MAGDTRVGFPPTPGRRTPPRPTLWSGRGLDTTAAGEVRVPMVVSRQRPPTCRGGRQRPGGALRARPPCGMEASHGGARVEGPGGGRKGPPRIGSRTRPGWRRFADRWPKLRNRKRLPSDKKSCRRRWSTTRNGSSWIASFTELQRRHDDLLEGSHAPASGRARGRVADRRTPAADGEHASANPRQAPLSLRERGRG